MQINVLNTPFQNLLGILNASNTLSLTAAQISFGVPQSAGPDADEDNTIVTASAVPLGGYTGTVDLTYRRLLLNASVLVVPSKIATNDTTTLESFKAAAAVSFNLVPSEFEVSGTLPAAFGEITTMTLTSVSTSLLYVGNITVSADWSTSLAGAVTVTNLTGFDPAV